MPPRGAPGPGRLRSPPEAAARRPPRTGVALTDARGRVHRWDVGAEELTGISAGEALGRELADVLASSHGFRHRLARALDRAARSGEPGEPLPLPRTAGRRVVRLHPLRPPGTVAAVFSDATAPVRGDDRSELLAAAFERSPVPTAVFDAGLRYVGVNRALQAVNGLPEPPHLGRSITDMLLSFGFTAEQAARVQAVAAEVRRTGTPAQDTLFTSAPDSVAPNGRWWNTRWYRLEGPQDRVLGVGVDVTDVTAREQVAAQARAGQERLALRDTVRDHRGDVAALCDRLVGSSVAGRRQDDVALLVAQVRTLPRDDVVSWDLAADPGAPRQARHLVGRQLAAWHLDDLIDVTELLVSELVTNAVRHGTPPITLRLLRLDRLRCEVSDHGRMLPHMRLAGPADEGGRGMHIVSMPGCRWGADRTDDGKTVWWEQDLGTGSDRAEPEAPLRPGTPPASG
ncbi:PAS domain-containing protein [Streptomyces sp. NPDC006743]|uniref:PAS domain-containing protein n=1 Tax=Streptomyces sp. NPDC006743 TaxID=3154480 RepID=UPI00345362F9